MCSSFIDFDAFYFIWTYNNITQNFYPNSKQDARERAALSDTSFQIKLPSSQVVLRMQLEMSLYITFIHCYILHLSTAIYYIYPLLYITFIHCYILHLSTALVAVQSWTFPGISEDNSIQWSQKLFRNQEKRLTRGYIASLWRTWYPK